MKLSRTAAYALHATLQLAASNSRAPVPCSRLAAAGQMPERFLLQILRTLVTHGILQSTRGVDGGYSLDRSPQDISLLEVIEAIDGPIDASLPRAGGSESARYDRRLREVLDQLAATTRRQLQSVKLSDLLVGSSASRSA